MNAANAAKVTGCQFVASRSRQRGLSLIELMIAMAIGVFMMIGIISLMLSVSRTRTELDKTSEQIESGRYAIQQLSDEVRLAGFYGTSQIVAAQTSLPDPCATAAALANLQFSYSASGAGVTEPLPIDGYAAGSTLPTCLTNATSGTEALGVHRVGNADVAPSTIGASNSAPYVQLSACDLDNVPFVFSATATDFVLRQKDCATTATIWPYLAKTFFLSGCDDCAANDGIPTLKVADQITGSIQTIAEGIQDIHFDYGIDLDKNGSPDCYVADPSVATAPANCPSGWGTAIQNWSNVVTVRVHLLARSVDPTPGWSDTFTYDLGRAIPSGPFNDQYKRQVYSAVIVIANVSGGRE